MINSVTFTCFIVTCLILKSIYCKKVAEDVTSNSNQFVIKNLAKGTKAVDYFYDVGDLEDSVKDQIIAYVSKTLKEKKSTGASNEDEGPFTFEIKNPIKDGKIKVEVQESLNDEPSIIYTRNASSYQTESDEYFPVKSVDGTNVMCEDWRTVALEKQRLKSSVFVPKCNPDGSYVTEQCDDIAGICWCVNQKGEEIGGTLVKFEKPKCKKKGPRKGIKILASGKNLIDIGAEEEVNKFKCEKEKRSLWKLRSYFNETTQRIWVPSCDNDDYSPIQCTARSGKEVARTGKIAVQPTDCSAQRKAEKKIAEVFHDWIYLWKVISEWLSSVRIFSKDASEDNADYVYKPKGVLVKLVQSSGFKKSMIFLPQESPDNSTETPYNAWLKVMKNENPNFDAHSYEVGHDEMSKYQSIEVPDGKGNHYMISVCDFLKFHPNFEDLWRKVKRNATEFEISLKKQEIDWKKMSEQPKPETADPTGLLAAGTFEVRSEQKICFCYSKRYWQKLQRFINGNQTTSAAGEPFVRGRSLKGQPRVSDVDADASGCRTVCSGSNRNKIDENIALIDGLTFQDVVNSDTSPEAQAKVDRVLKNRIMQINPMRNLLQMNVEHFEKLSGIEFYSIEVPLHYFSLQFWNQLSEYTNEPLPSIEQKLGFDLKKSMEQTVILSNTVQSINMGKLIQLMSQANLNTKQLLELAGYSTRKMLDDFENNMFIAVRGSLKAISIPYKFVTGYLFNRNPVTKVTSSPVNSEPTGIPGTVMFRTGLCNFGYSMTTMIKSVPEYLKDFQIYFGAKHKCKTNCPTFNSDMTSYIKYMASFTNNANHAVQVNIGARIYRQVPFYVRLYLRKTLRKLGFTFLLANEAHFEMMYQAGAMMAIGIVKPFVKIPYIIFLGEGSIIDRTLGTFPAIIELTGDLLKPIMVISEPLLRGKIFLSTGDWRKALDAGRQHNAHYEKNVLVAFNGRPLLLENYQPWSIRRGQIMGPDGIPIDVENPYEQENYDSQTKNSETIHRGQVIGPDGIPIDVENPNEQENPSKIKNSKTDKSPLTTRAATIETKIEITTETTQSVTPGADPVSYVDIKPEEDMLPVNTTVDPDEVETTFLDRYQGMAPKTGYQVDLNRFSLVRNEAQIQYGFISRVVHLPYFLVAAGGPVFGPSASLVTPVINITTLFLYTRIATYDKIRQVPDILEKSSAFYKPFTLILNGFLPITDLLYDFWNGRASAIQTTARAPVAFMSLATSPVKFIVTGPAAMFQEALQFFIGPCGLKSMITLQFSESYIGNKRGYIFRRASEGYSRSKIYISRDPQQDNLLFVASFMLVYYVKPHIDVASSLFNGGVGNVIDPYKAYQYQFFHWKCDPYNSMVKLSQNQAAMYEVAADKDMFIQAILGGEDPDELKMVGIDASKMIRGNIDPMKVLLGGKNLLPVEQQSWLVDQRPSQDELYHIGIDESYLTRLNITYEQLMYGGLWNVNPELLIEYGIDPFFLVNRMMRNSIINKNAFLSCGISVKKMLSVGIRPDYFFAGGVSTINAKTYKLIGINPTRTNDAAAFYKMGISFDILTSLQIDPVKLIENGVAPFDDSVVSAVFGIDKQKLLSSVYLGFSEPMLYKMGIQLKKMFRSGYSPAVLVTGSPTLAKMNEQQLLQVGFNLKQMRSTDLKPRSLLSRGIMSNDLYKFNRLGVNADQLLSALYAKSGVGVLAENNYKRGDDEVYSMAVSLSSIAQKNGVSDYPELYHFFTKEKRSCLVIARDMFYQRIGFDSRGGFISFIFWNSLYFIKWLIAYIIFQVPHQLFNLFGMVTGMFYAAASTLSNAMF